MTEQCYCAENLSPLPDTFRPCGDCALGRRTGLDRRIEALDAESPTTHRKVRDMVDRVGRGRREGDGA